MNAHITDKSEKGRFEVNLKEFPSTRYQGSKRKILPWIYAILKELKFESCLDAFGGTASVSYLFKKMGKSVTYNDNMRFNYLIGKAIIENDKIKLNSEELFSFNNVCNYDFVHKNFHDIYYLNHENKWIDHVVESILNMNHYPEHTLQYKKAIAYYALFQSCLIKRPFNLFHRRNLNLRMNDVKRNFGNKVSWDKPFRHYFKHFIMEANELIFTNGKKCFCKNDSAFDIEGEYDLVYLDPPYITSKTSNETSHYIKCYHFLEGLSKYDEWKNLIDFESINLRFKNSESGNDSNEHNVYNKFEILLDKFQKSVIVFSYKRGGKPSIQYLINLMKKFKKNVYSKSIHYSYALNHQNGDAKKNREVIIVGY